MIISNDWLSGEIRDEYVCQCLSAYVYKESR